MNLQINGPYKKCPYQCPYCVAGVEDKNHFPFSDDFYTDHKELYLSRMVDVIQQRSVTTAVITASTEPTLFPEWIQEVVMTIRPFVEAIEIQTKNYSWTQTYGGKIDVLAYSHDKIPTFHRPQLYPATVRDVFIWNKFLTAREIVDYFNLHRNVVDQCTAKQMVDCSYGTKAINDYIKSVRIPFTTEDISLFTSAGVRVDPNCDASEGRYLVYRTNGNLYQRWSDTAPLAI